MPCRQLQKRPPAVEQAARPRRAADCDPRAAVVCRSPSFRDVRASATSAARPTAVSSLPQALQIDRGDRQIGIAQMKKAELEPRLVAGSETQHRRHREIERARFGLQFFGGQVAPCQLNPVHCDDFHPEHRLAPAIAVFPDGSESSADRGRRAAANKAHRGGNRPALCGAPKSPRRRYGFRSQSFRDGRAHATVAAALPPTRIAPTVASMATTDDLIYSCAWLMRRTARRTKSILPAPCQYFFSFIGDCAIGLLDCSPFLRRRRRCVRRSAPAAGSTRPRRSRASSPRPSAAGGDARPDRRPGARARRRGAPRTPRQRRHRRVSARIRAVLARRGGAAVPRRGAAAHARRGDRRPADPRQDRRGELGTPSRPFRIALRQCLDLGADADRPAAARRAGGARSCAARCAALSPARASRWCARR